MGVSRSVGQDPSPAAGRSILFYFTTRLAVPVGCLALAWGGLTAVVLSGELHRWLGPHPHRAVIESAVVAGAGLVVVLVAVIAFWSLARRLSRQAADLADMARYLADEQVPRAVARLREGTDGAQPMLPPPPPPPGRSKNDKLVAELAAVSVAVSRLRAAALAAATAEAALRGGFRQVLTSLGRRNQSLLHRQLRIIDTLEQQAASPAALADLFALDHLTTRMRRHAESLTVLASAPAPRPRSGPVPVIDVIRAAVAETEDYKRVSVRTESEEAVAASAVNDMIHLLAELVENATLFSPSTTRVEVRAERVANGFAIEVEDRGLGIAAAQLAELNQRLANPPDFDVVDADRLGLFVAGRLAARHAVEVSLCPSPYRGTKAVVLLPDALVLAPADSRLPGISGMPGIPSLPGRLTADVALTTGPELSQEPFTLVGAAVINPLSNPGTDDVDLSDVGGQVQERPTTTPHGLPRRVRPDSDDSSEDFSAVAGLRSSPSGRHHRSSTPTQAPAPDDARRLAASLQSGWLRREAAESEPAENDAAENEAVAASDAWDTKHAVEQAWPPQHNEEES
jgi:signal transduction histidine kinase